MAPKLHLARGSSGTSESIFEEVEEYFRIGIRLPKGATIFDVGANIGAFAARAAELCDGDVRLFCFEPSPETYEALEKNIADVPVLARSTPKHFMMGLTSDATAGQELPFYSFRRFPTNSTLDLSAKRREFEMFFEDRGERARLAIDAVLGGLSPKPLTRALEKLISSVPKGELSWWVTRHAMGLETVSAKLETLSAIVDRYSVTNIDLVKIDVEGHETAVLEGIREEHWPLVQAVVMETHNRDGRQDRMTALLTRHGLTDLRVVEQATVDNGLHSVLLLAKRPGALA